MSASLLDSAFFDEDSIELIESEVSRWGKLSSHSEKMPSHTVHVELTFHTTLLSPTLNR